MMALRPPVADRLLAAAAFVLGVVVAITLEAVDFDGERSVDLWAIALLGAMSAPLLARRRWPILVVLAVLAVSTPYHLLDYPHEATMPASLVAAFAAARYSEPPRRAVAALVAVVAVTVPVVADEASGHLAMLSSASAGCSWPSLPGSRSASIETGRPPSPRGSSRSVPTRSSGGSPRSGS